MALKISEGASFPPPPAGLLNAICIMVVDLGPQSGPFGNKPKILLGWELPDCPMDDGKPYVISRQFGATLSKKGNLRPIVEAWRGRGFTAEEAKSFDMGVLLGKGCKLLVQHVTGEDGRVHANIQAALRPESGQPTIPVNDLVFFDQDSPDLSAKSKLPQWVQKIIDQAIPPTVKPVTAAPTAALGFDDDLTF